MRHVREVCIVGRAHRIKPARLAEKLRAIREGLDLTQPELIKALKVKGARLHPASISLYEQGKREPALLVLLAYARLAGTTLDALADDKQNLPRRFR